MRAIVCHAQIRRWFSAEAMRGDEGKELVLAETSPRSLLVRRGDVLLMRPLLAHASNRSCPGTERHRRILHLEFAASPDLPDDYAWHMFLAGWSVTASVA
jgi:hypothetical protein